MKNAIDLKIETLSSITDEFIYPEYYTHEGKKMYKIKNVFTNYGEEVLVLSGVDEGIETSLDVAIKYLSKKQKAYYK